MEGEERSRRVPETGDKGLKRNAIRFADALIIGLAAVAPAYALAAAIGLMVATVGVQAPAVLLVSFVPIFLAAAAFYYMNRADQDCGTVFSWVTRAMGPWMGWMAGWAIYIAIVLVTGSLADVSSRYTLLLVVPAAAGSKVVVTALAVVFIAVMTLICVLGVELSARLQNVLIVAQTIALAIFAVVALAKVFGGETPLGSLRPELSWFSPFAVESTSALASGLLLGVFFYWGWNSTVNLTEETEHSATAPGLAAVLSTVILLLTYLSVAVAIVAFAGVGNVAEFADDDAVLGTVATGVLGSPLDKLVVLAVMTSALGATQLAILGAARTSLSMAYARAMPSSLGKVHPRFLTPHVSTIVVGVLAIIWYAPLNLIAENFLSDTLSGLSLMVTFHYALAGFACVIYYRRELLKSLKNFVFIGVAPLIGAALLTYIFVESLIALADPGQSHIGGSLFGLGLPLVVGLGFLVLGAILMVSWRLLDGNESFFGRRGLEAVDPEVAAGRVAASSTTDTTRSS